MSTPPPSSATDPSVAESPAHTFGHPHSYSSPNRRWLALAVLLTGNFVNVLDLFIVNVALESIQKEIGATFTQVQLIVVSYSVAYAVLLMNGARLGDLFGRRRMFMFGMTLFTGASLLCGLAPTPDWLIGARVVQGIGSAIMMPQVLASIRLLFEGHERRRAFGIMGAVQGSAAALSQILGGLLIESNLGGAGWRLIFLVNLPVGIAALIAGQLLLVESKAPVATKLDLRGAFLGALGLSMLLVPFMEGREYGWPWWSIVVPLGALVVFAYFVHYEKGLSARGGVPVIEMSLFGNRAFVVGVMAILLMLSAMSSFFLSLTMLLQAGLGLSPFIAGAIFTPAALAFFSGSLAAPRLARRFGPRTLPVGVLIFAAGLALAAVVAGDTRDSLALMIVALIVNGFGQGIAIPLALNTILGGVRADQAGMGSGVVSTVQTAGAAIGVAIVGVLLFSVIEHENTATPALRAAVYAHAFTTATLYNVAAALLSFVMFVWLYRLKKASQSRG